jgi:hypothetical protein
VWQGAFWLAIYHLHVQMISRSTGRSAVAAAAYRAGERLHSEYDGLTHDCRSSVGAAAYQSGEKLTHDKGKTHDFTNKKGVVYSEIILPDHAPSEFYDRQTLWNAVEKSEKRKDAQTARELDVALPTEFDRQEQIQIMQEYIKENFIKHGMIADFSIHDKQDGNPHSHILLTTRNVDDNGFSGKNRDWNKAEYLQKWRENWAEICNQKLREHEKIDHRTLKAQGIDREPTIHEGHRPEKIKQNQEIIARNTAKKIHELKENYANLDKETAQLNLEKTELQTKINGLRYTIEEIKERAENIKSMQNRLEYLREKRLNMGVFENKKHLEEQIKRLEYSHETATEFFQKKYKITPEQAEKQIEILEQKASELADKKAFLQHKLAPFNEEKSKIILEYQKQKLLAEISPNGLKIAEELEKFGKNKAISIQEKLLRANTDRKLDIISDENFAKIINEIRPEQAKKLARLRGFERMREPERWRGR